MLATWLIAIWRFFFPPSVKTLLMETLHTANSYDEWQAAALQIDQVSEMDEWRSNDSGITRDIDMIRARTDALQAALDVRDIRRMIEILRSGLSRGFLGIIRPQLYGKAIAGTKYCITDYVRAVTETITAISDALPSRTDPKGLAPQEKLDFLHDTRLAYGRSALVLQGGSMFGLCHLGAVKELLHQDMLPRIIAGSATGALMAALVGIHTDDELPAFLHGDGINLRYFAASSMKAQQDSLSESPKPKIYRTVSTFYRRLRRYLSSGFVLDPEVLGKSVQANIGDLTFEQAYKRTNRILNITISPTGPGAITLLNYLTAPHVLIWTAAMVSNVAEPRHSPLYLRCRDIDGSIVRYSVPTQREFRRPREQDQESPLGRLGELFNVNHFVVSQARPYIAPLLYPSIRGPQRGAASMLWGLLVEEIKFRTKMFDDWGLLSPGMRRLLLDEVVPGPSVTLVPEISWHDWTRLLRNPTAEEINHWIKRGERSVWPLVHQLQVRLRAEFQIDRGYQMVKQGGDSR